MDGNGINKAMVQPPTGGKTRLELVKIHSYVDNVLLANANSFSGKNMPYVSIKNFLL